MQSGHTKMKSTVILFLVAIPFFILNGCSTNEELSRDYAKNIILQNSQYPDEVTTRLITQWNTTAVLGGADEFLSSLKANNLATGSHKIVNIIVNGKRTRFKKSNFEIALTQPATQYIRESEKVGFGKAVKVVVYSGDLSEITGITYTNPEKTSAIVEFTEEYKPTPFASVLFPSGKKARKFTLRHPTRVNQKASFRLYDDGWRMVNRLN